MFRRCSFVLPLSTVQISLLAILVGCVGRQGGPVSRAPADPLLSPCAGPGARGREMFPMPNRIAKPLEDPHDLRTAIFGQPMGSIRSGVWWRLLSLGVLPTHRGALETNASADCARSAGTETGCLFSRSEIGLGTLYPRHLDVVQDYVAAMTLYRLSPSEEGLKASVLVLDWVGTDGLPDAFRLVWNASNGNLVARIGKGLFRISLGNYRANWFHDLDCRLMNWSGGEIEAAVSCADGQDRRMTVPGTGLLDDRR